MGFDKDAWWGIMGLILVSAIFGGNDKILKDLLKGDEKMEDKITAVKELMLDKIMSKIEDPTTSLEDFDKIAILLQKLSFSPYSFGFSGLNGLSAFNGSSKLNEGE